MILFENILDDDEDSIDLLNIESHLDSADFNVKKLSKLSDKMKWYKRFYKSYIDSAFPQSEKLYSSDTRHFVAYKKDIELGYLYISNWGKQYMDENNAGWSISAAYVKPKYRKQGVFRWLVNYCYNNENTKLIYIDIDAYKNNLDYFYSMGFEKYIKMTNGRLIYICKDEFYSYVKERGFIR